jgi:hypothetical protein
VIQRAPFSSSTRISYSRVVLLFSVALYIAAFNGAYRFIVVPIFGSWGFGALSLPLFYWLTSVVACLIPAMWMPIAFSRPSLLLFYVQYFLVFVPACFIVYGSNRPMLPLNDALALVVAMFVGITLIQSVYLLRPRAIRALRVSPAAFWIAFAIVSVVMVSYLVITLGGSFRLVSFQDVYSLRQEMGETISATGTRFGLYAQSLLSALILPLAFASGLAARKRSVIVPVALGYVFLFGIGGAKATALAIVYLPLVALLMSRPPRRIPRYFVLGLTFAVSLGFLTRLLLSPELNLAYTAVVHFRLLTVPPLTIPQYFDFFQSHPLTHFSHVTGFNWFLAFPYDLDVPYTIGTYFYGTPVGVNSGLWAGDGIAGFGILGIPLVSLICAFVFWLLDSASAEFEPRFIAQALTFCTVFFGNVSLFTTLITGGLGFLIVATLLAPRDTGGAIRLPRRPHFKTVATGDAA